MNAEAIKTVLREATERELAFLREYSFAFTAVSEEYSEALKTWFTASLTNAVANRVVRVTYFPRKTGAREVAITDITRVEPESREWDDYTSLGSMQVRVTDLTDERGDLAARLTFHLHAAARTLHDQFLPVLLGREWKSDHLDWGGLK